MTEQLQKKIQRAIRLLQSYKSDEPVEVAYSGGKDSDVILQLVKEAGIPYRALYKCTTIDPPGTIKHALEMGAELVKPKQTFREIIETCGMPNRIHRFCCQKLKEYKILDKSVIGVRKAESTKRAKRYTELTECRVFRGGQHVEAIYPILEWTDDDVLEFILDRGLKINPHYYREDGTIDVKRRVGCMCCPLQSTKKRKEEFRKYPNMVKVYLKALGKYRATHPQCKSVSTHKDEYEQFCHDVFYPGSRDWNKHKDELFHQEVDYKSFLEGYFNIKL